MMYNIQSIIVRIGDKDMNERDRALVIDFKRRLPSEMLRQVKRLIVFGSRARGETTEDSDLDMIALVNEKKLDIEKKLEDIAYQIMENYDFKPIISLKVFEESQFYNAINKGFSFYRHVEEEGVVI